MNWNAELVDQLEWHWQHQLRPRLDGLTDDEYFWKPVPGSWTLSRRGQSSAPISIGAGEFTLDYASPPPDRAPVTTIAWRLAHLIDVFGPPTAPHFDGSLADRRAVAFAGTASAALRQLDEGHDAWIGDVRHLGAAGLAWPQGHPPEYADAPMAKLILHVHREVIHHGAEICLLRDLYLWKAAKVT
ncbi:DinB family protein [Micromonospora terminaliae]|uniref:DinB family protein n=1 Tax=Micromonospora terminaliae TaxID=1914461 RepID=A0AAJ2ZF33_9ACTN|nr:DinB family protein [Micromonospora terminaliae]QGL51485.1 DinB family protein [Micromonospora terminaliae]